MICRQWGSEYSTVAFVGVCRWCRCTGVLPGVRVWRETVAVAVSLSVGSGLGSGRGLESRAGVS